MSWVEALAGLGVVLAGIGVVLAGLGVVLAGLGVILAGVVLAVIAWRTRTVLAFMLGAAGSVIVPLAVLLRPTPRAPAAPLILGAVAVTVGFVLYVIGQRLERLLTDEPDDERDAQSEPGRSPDAEPRRM